MSSETGWCTIESDPAVFAEIIYKLGATSLDVEEVYDLDAASISNLGPVYGLIFLFKWEASKEQESLRYSHDLDVFFAKQVLCSLNKKMSFFKMVQNACATQAILSILLNLKADDATIGESLTKFKSFTNDFDSSLKGIAIGENELFRQTHNSFGNPYALYFDHEDDRSEHGKEDPFHFISILPVNGKILEFDGLKEAPIVLADEAGNWLELAVEAIKKKIQKAQSSKASEIRFNLMAVTKDRESQIRAELQLLGSKSSENQWQVEDLVAELQYLAQVREARAKENAMRQHNFIPFVMAILNKMASKGKL